MTKTVEAKQGSGPESAVKEEVVETKVVPTSAPKDGRLSEGEALKLWDKKFSLDTSRRSFEPNELREIDIHAKNTPTSEKFPDGMWGQLVLINANTKRPEDKSMNIAYLPSEEYRDDKGIHSIDHTSRTIKFRNGVLDLSHSQSFDVLRFLVQTKDYGREYIVEESDLGGIWRFLGLVEEVPITITKVVRKAV